MLYVSRVTGMSLHKVVHNPFVVLAYEREVLVVTVRLTVEASVTCFIVSVV